MSIFKHSLKALPFVVAGFIYNPAPAVAACANCSTWVIQAVEYAEQIQQHATQAENLKRNLEQYEQMIKEFELNDRAVPNYIKQRAMADLQALAGIVAAGRAVAYSSGQIDEDYQREHRSFEYYEEMQRGEHGQRDHVAFNERYRDWAEVNHDSVRGALRAAGLQAQQFDREDSALRAIEEQMESAVGTKQLLQAGGSIAAMQVEQLQKLRQLQMAQMQLQSAQVGGAIDRTAEDDADLQRALKPLEGLDDGRGGGLGWGGSIR